MKQCSVCEAHKPEASFYARGNKQGKRSECINCTRAANVARRPRYKEKERRDNHDWHMANRSQVAKRKRYQLFKQYGLPLEQYEAMLTEQSNLCFICVRPFGTKGPCVDHSHRTGKVRRILCTSCNSALGQAKDNPLILRAMADYLEKFQ